MPAVEVEIGKGALQKIPEIREKLKLATSCLIVDDVNTREVAGKDIMDLLQGSSYKVSEIIVDKPDETNVERVAEKAGEQDFLIGVGGTSVLDVTKLAAYKRRARYMLFSTGIANNGMSSKTASVYIKGRKETIPTNMTDAVIVDLAIVSKAPAWMVAAGCGDLVAETTAIKDWQLGRDEMSESYCESVAELELSALNNTFSNIDAISRKTEAGIKSLVDSLVKSGLAMTIWGSSRPASGSEHLWSHWLDHYAEENKTKFGQHGEQVGIGTILMSKYHELYNGNWWSRERWPKYQAETTMSLLKKVGAHTTPAEIGVERELAKQAFLGAWEYRRERYTVLHKRHPTRDDAERVMKELGM